MPPARADVRAPVLPRLCPVLLAALAACSIEAGGNAPPLNRLFYPAALHVDGSGRWLYVVNSNSDLKFNAGTVTAVDLAAVAAHRTEVVATWPLCPDARYVPDKPPAPAQNCCRDLLDPQVLNCDERAYIPASATVQTGSFGSAITAQTYTVGGQARERLFVAVRSDPSITFIDTFAGTTPDAPRTVCTGTPGALVPPGDVNPLCADAFRVRRREAEPTRAELPLPEEPFALTLDPALGVLYTAHSFTGVSVTDVCSPELGRAPRLEDVLERPNPGTTLGSTAVELGGPGNPSATIFAPARGVPFVSTMLLRGAEAGGCPADPAQKRDLSLVLTGAFASNAFALRGTQEVRDFLLAPGNRRAYLLHRNSGGGPSALVRLERDDEAPEPTNWRPAVAVEICSGPGRLIAHDAGRGMRLVVPCFEAGQVYVVEPERMFVEGIVDVGRGPSWVAFSPTDPKLAYLAGFSDNNVSVIDFAPGSPTEYRVIQRIGFPRQAPSR